MNCFSKDDQNRSADLDMDSPVHQCDACGMEIARKDFCAWICIDTTAKLNALCAFADANGISQLGWGDDRRLRRDIEKEEEIRNKFVQDAIEDERIRQRAAEIGWDQSFCAQFFYYFDMCRHCFDKHRKENPVFGQDFGISENWINLRNSQ